MVLMEKKRENKTKKNIVLSTTTVRLSRNARMKKILRQSTIAGSNCRVEPEG